MLAPQSPLPVLPAACRCGQVLAVVQPGEPPVVVKVYRKELLNRRLQRNVQREVAVLTKLHQ